MVSPLKGSTRRRFQKGSEYGCGSQLNRRANRRFWSKFSTGKPFWNSGFLSHSHIFDTPVSCFFVGCRVVGLLCCCAVRLLACWLCMAWLLGSGSTQAASPRLAWAWSKPPCASLAPKRARRSGSRGVFRGYASWGSWSLLLTLEEWLVITQNNGWSGTHF